MKEFLLLFREYQSQFDRLAPEDFDGVLDEFLRWNDSLRAGDHLIDQGRLKRGPGVTLGGDPDSRASTERRTVRDPGTGGVSVDGPFAEAREAIGGYYRIRARDVSEVAELVRDCPILKHGGRIEVREIEAPRYRSKGESST